LNLGCGLIKRQHRHQKNEDRNAIVKRHRSQKKTLVALKFQAAGGTALVQLKKVPAQNSVRPPQLGQALLRPRVIIRRRGIFIGQNQCDTAKTQVSATDTEIVAALNPAS